MREAKIKVPDGMTEAAVGYARQENSPGSKDHYRAVLNVALQWLDERIKHLKETEPHKQAKPEAYKAALEDVRRLYDDPEPEVPEETSVIALVEKRMAEYSDWVAENLIRAAQGFTLLPPLEWDKRGMKVFTYGDFARKVGTK
jgi:hypothetical protein